MDSYFGRVVLRAGLKRPCGSSSPFRQKPESSPVYRGTKASWTPAFARVPKLMDWFNTLLECFHYELTTFFRSIP
jgi:hypothetical protein